MRTHLALAGWMLEPLRVFSPHAPTCLPPSCRPADQCRWEPQQQPLQPCLFQEHQVELPAPLHPPPTSQLLSNSRPLIPARTNSLGPRTLLSILLVEEFRPS